jgi:hypothetical protein
MRPALCDDALRLDRILARLAPREPEAHGLVALMEIQASRAAARTGPDGEPVLQADRNRARWDQLLIRRGLAALGRAETLSDGKPGAYEPQAAIAACHARARRFPDTDWKRLAALHARPAEAMPSPVVELNRAMALSMAAGPALPNQLTAFPVIRNYHLLPSVRSDLLAEPARHAEARDEFERAASLTRNERERSLPLDGAAACDQAMRANAPDRPRPCEPALHRGSPRCAAGRSAARPTLEAPVVARVPRVVVLGLLGALDLPEGDGDTRAVLTHGDEHPPAIVAHTAAAVPPTALGHGRELVPALGDDRRRTAAAPLSLVGSSVAVERVGARHAGAMRSLGALVSGAIKHRTAMSEEWRFEPGGRRLRHQPRV